MEISNNEDKDTGWNLKKAKPFEESKDFISDLPDPILSYILSFLPIKDAINTVLLRRFGDLWRNIQVLDLSSCLYHDCEDEDYCPDYLNEKFVNIIHYVLNLHDNSMLDKLRLKFCFGLIFSKGMPLFAVSENDLEWEKGTAVLIEKLIRYAISRKVKVLDINLKGCDSLDPREYYDLPDLLSSNFLTDLWLAAFDIRSCRKIHLESLRVLSLH